MRPVPFPAPAADLVLTTSVAGPPPFDSATSSLALVESLVAAVAERLGDAARSRLADFEERARGLDVAAVEQVRRSVPDR